jgi:hypothetical protein
MKNLAVGLGVLSGKSKTQYVAAEHDIIYITDVNLVDLTDHEKAMLEAHGWHVDSEFNCWAFFT